MEFERVAKLKFKIAKNIFYNILNICYNFTYNSWFHCSCRKFYGCPLENGEQSYCFICQICTGYDIQEIEKMQKNSTIIDIHQNLKNDIKNALILNFSLIAFGVLTIKQPGAHMGTVCKHIWKISLKSILILKLICKF